MTSTQEPFNGGQQADNNPLMSPIFHRPATAVGVRPPLSKVPRMENEDDAADEEEQVKKLIQPKSSSIKRRFPGPAGILPR